MQVDFLYHWSFSFRDEEYMSDFGSGFAMRVVFLGRLAHGARMVEGDSLPKRSWTDGKL